MPDQLYSSEVSMAGRRAAPAVVRLVGAVRLLASASAAGRPGTRALSGIVELVAAERGQLLPQIPLVVSLLNSVLRCKKACTPTRQCGVESLAQVLGSTRRLSETFALYDCDARRPDVLGPALEALGWAASQAALRRGALEVLVGITRSIVAGLREAGATSMQPGPWASSWAEREQEGKNHKEWAHTFNRDPEEWWRKHKECVGADAAGEAARMIQERSRALDRNVVGALLCKHKDILQAFVDLHDLEGLDLAPAFGLVLHSMSPPGEAQQVDRFCECLGGSWGRANSIDPEAAYIFAFSLVMLSTDLHSARPVAGYEKMTYDQFSKNLRSALPKGKLPEHMVRHSYDQIRQGALLSARSPGQVQEQETLNKACVRLRLALRRQVAAGQASVRGGGCGAAEQAALHPLTGALGDLWRCAWAASWAPLLGAFSAGAHAAGEDEELQEVALRGLQLGCEASALLGEADRAEAFCMALQQLSSMGC